MSGVTRQALARYAFFQASQKESLHSEDALVPLILPAVVGKANELFSAQALADELKALFGTELVLSLAESMTQPLVRAGYLARGPSDGGAAVYIYTTKANEITIDESVRSAQLDLDALMAALFDFIKATPRLKPLSVSDLELRDKFVDWITTVEAAEFVEADADPSSRITKSKPPAPRATVEVPRHLQLIFSSFVGWVMRERVDLAPVVSAFAEIGLIMDVVSEIRLPTRKNRTRVDLTIVLDTRLILELLGLYGPASERSMIRLLQLCSTHGIVVTTLVHIVDEVNELCFNVAENPDDTAFPESVQAAIRQHPDILNLVKRALASPDALIKSKGVRINPRFLPESSTRFFDAKNIREFIDVLPYDKRKVNMAKRDAWSLAYAVGRQNGAHPSNLYEAKCLILTRTALFVEAARRYLRSDAVGYPGYAAIPIMELRHFSTMLMLSFGSELSRGVIRSELVASCERIVRVTPALTGRLRAVIGQMNAMPEEQLEAVLNDPTTLAEFALASGNDPAVITRENGPALIEVIRSAATKDAELRFRTLEHRREAVIAAEREKEREAARLEREVVEAEKREALVEVAKRSEEANKRAGELEAQIDVNASIIAASVKGAVRVYWGLVVLVGTATGMALGADVFVHFTGLETWQRILAGAPLALLVMYSIFVLFVPEVEPKRLRAWLLRREARRVLKRYANLELHRKVWNRLGVES